MSTVNYRRPGFVNRPWIAGGLYDKYSAREILHCDARVLDAHAFKVLTLDWREGGRTQIADDAYLIEPDGLTPLWARDFHLRPVVPVYWTRANHALMSRLHRAVLGEVAKAEASGRWARVVVQCHYVHVRETNGEIARNGYKVRGEEEGTS